MPAQQICAGCRQTDDAPRHTGAVSSGLDLPQPWHLDCHVLDTGCESCAEQLRRCGTDAAPDGLKNDALRQRLIALRDNDTQED